MKIKKQTDKMDRHVRQTQEASKAAVIRRTKDGATTRINTDNSIHPVAARPLVKYIKPKSKVKPVKSRIQIFADHLNADLPQSEVWFHKLWEAEGFQDIYNTPCGRYIPDVINYKYNYIIEIDGSFNSKEQQYKDRVKDLSFKRSGYQVFRVEAFNMDSFNTVLSNVRMIVAGISPVPEQGRQHVR